MKVIKNNTRGFIETLGRSPTSILQGLCLDARKVLFWHDEFGFDYNFNYHRGETDHRKVEAFLHELTDRKVTFVFISHRDLIIKINGQPVDKCATNEFGSYGNRNMKDNNDNNPYRRVASILQKLSSGNNRIVTINKTIMEKFKKKENDALAQMKDEARQRVLGEIASSDVDAKSLSEEDINMMFHVLRGILTDPSSPESRYLEQNPEVLSRYIKAISHDLMTASIAPDSITVKDTVSGLAFELPITDGKLNTDSKTLELLKDVLDFAARHINHAMCADNSIDDNSTPPSKKQSQNSNAKKHIGDVTQESGITKQMKLAYNANVMKFIKEGVFDEITSSDKSNTWKKQSISGKLSSCLTAAGASKTEAHRKAIQFSLLNNKNREKMRDYYVRCGGDASDFNK